MRLVDLLAGLSRLADLGFGIPVGEALRTSALTAALARSLDLPDEDVRAGLYTALLLHAGCVAYAHETARDFGDEHTFNRAAMRTDPTRPQQLFTTFLPTLTRERPPLQTVQLTFALLTHGKRHGEAYVTTVCEVGQNAARRMGLSDSVQASIYHAYEFFGGRGIPDGLRGDAIPLGARVAQVASTACLTDSVGGHDAAVEAVRERAGRILDPDVVQHLVQHPDLLEEVRAGDPRDLVLAAEPTPVAQVHGRQLFEVAEVFGDLADLKSPYTHGHSRGVATLARGAGEQLGCSGPDLDELELAGSLHDVGRVAISSAIWDKPRELSAHEWEQVRLHAYHAERILAGSQELAPLAQLVGRHHERLDGSGYHRGSTSADLSRSARVLAAADAYRAMTEPRPHRPAMDPEQAEHELRDAARTEQLDAQAVAAVLAAAGHASKVRRSPTAELTDREVEVLQLVADGCSNAEVAERLVISRRTAEHHVQHIYTKLGVSSRAAATLFAVEHGLLRR